MDIVIGWDLEDSPETKVACGLATPIFIDGATKLAGLL